MSDVNVNKLNSQNIKQQTPVQTCCVPTYTTVPFVPCINNYNGYIPTYVPQYYTTNYAYPTSPYAYQQYQNVQQPKATIQAGGTTCNVPQGTNGLNIIINSPTVAAPGSNPLINTNTNCNGNNGADKNSNATATATASADGKKSKKDRKIVALTDDYIKNLENYLRSPDKELKKFAIKEIAKRFEEDDSRKGNKSLNALLNLALQAKESSIRGTALSLLNAGVAGGNDNTVQLLNLIQQNGRDNGFEAQEAKTALLKMSETVVKVPDNSADKEIKKETANDIK